MSRNYLASAMFALFLFTTAPEVAAQAPADGMEISALKARYADEKTKLTTDKEKYEQLKKELDDLKSKIKVQEDNLKLVEKRIKNDEKLSKMKN
ncbi:MAG TPA: hypothetical protein VEX68_19705 [Bryobacteraceae bacterium]|nr:hypothetical protein [Bryobacteraceae bacterium]